MFRVLAFLLVVAVAPTDTARGADDEAKAIINKAIKAHGGEELLTKMQAGQSQNKGKIKLPGVGEVDFTQEVAYMLPDKFKDSLNLEIANMKIAVNTVVNGDKISINAAGKDVDITDDIKKAMADAMQMMKAARLVPLIKDKGYELSMMGDVKVNNKPCVGVRVAGKGKKEFALYFDKETNLMAKIEFRSVSQATQMEITEERIIVEYQKKEKDAPPMPKKVVVKHDGEQFLEAEVVEAKLLEKIDDSEFKK